MEKGRLEDPDTLTATLQIDDDVLRKITKNLYYPASPYEFSVFSADILGQVYEQFLGKVISLKNHRAKVEDKPEVKKAGGVVYTPTSIVEFIVKKTIGPLLVDKKPSQVSKFRVVDPACGSGSFLLVAYQHLLDWHLGYYTANSPSKHKNAIVQTKKDTWQLSLAERKRILKNCISVSTLIVKQLR